MNTTATDAAKPSVLATGSDDRDRSITIFTDAFRTDPAARWLFPDGTAYDNAFAEFATAFTGPAFAAETAFHTPCLAGACAWFPPGVDADEEGIITAIRQHVPADRLDDAFRIIEQMDDFHPDYPHWYLPLIGVRPGSRGAGLGTRLLRHVLRECDRTGHDAYLESSNPANLTLYQRHGFRLIGKIQAGSSPTLHPMLRQAQ